MLTPINGDAFRAMCDHTFWHNAEPWENPHFRSGDVVFCKIDEVWRLFRALRRTRKRIVLVTGEGDKPVTEELWGQKPAQVFHWFGSNHFVDDPAGTPLPLGLGNAGGAATLEWDQLGGSSDAERSGLLYANFRAGSNPEVRGPLLQWLAEPSQSWITGEAHGAEGGKEGYLKRLRNHHFVLCPPGNGEDTHRMWEALYAGAIPVVRESPAMREFRDLPILFFEDLRSVTEAVLREDLQRRTNEKKTLEKLDAAYWRDRIESKRVAVRRLGRVSAREWILGWTKEIVRILQKFRHPEVARITRWREETR